MIAPYAFHCENRGYLIHVANQGVALLFQHLETSRLSGPHAAELSEALCPFAQFMPASKVRELLDPMMVLVLANEPAAVFDLFRDHAGESAAIALRAVIDREDIEARTGGPRGRVHPSAVAPAGPRHFAQFDYEGSFGAGFDKALRKMEAGWPAGLRRKL